MTPLQKIDKIALNDAVFTFFISMLIILASCKADQSGEWRPSGNQNVFLDMLQEDTFRFFLETTNPDNGLVPDRHPDPPFSSIAATGFGLSAFIIGVERGYISREEAAEITHHTVRFFLDAPQGPEPEGNSGYKGFFYHFIDMESGERYQQTELSTIDTALLLAGMLTSQSYFNRDTPVEREIRDMVDAVYARVDWQWAISQTEPPLIGHGWTPENGFIPHTYSGYDEAMILYLLALGSPTFPIEPEAWEAYTRTYSWDEFYGYEFVNYSPMFVHHYSHMFVDFRDIRDAYMERRGIDYFENSRRATLSQREYAIDNPGNWSGYGEFVWGLTASDGPGYATWTDEAGIERETIGYSARGASSVYIRDDGTLAPTALGGSVPFAPEETITSLHYLYREFGEQLYGEYGFLDAFNMSIPPDLADEPYEAAQDFWVNSQYLGIDQGPILIQIENFRSGLIWEITQANPYLRAGLERAGFSGGWLEE